MGSTDSRSRGSIVMSSLNDHRTRSCRNDEEIGGLGYTMKHVVELLKSVTTEDDGSAATRHRSSHGGSGLNSGARPSTSSGGPAAASVYSIPLTAKRGLAIAYLEALTEEGFATRESQDELGRLLVDGMVEESGKLFGEFDDDDDDDDDEDIVNFAVSLKQGDSLVGKGNANSEHAPPKSLGKRFRSKLRSFLSSSKHYDAQRMLAMLDEVGGDGGGKQRGGKTSKGTQHEKALVLCRLGQHDRVLSIYVHQLRDVNLAESYCERIYMDAAAQLARAEDLGAEQMVEEGQGNIPAGRTGADEGSLAAAVLTGADGGVAMIASHFEAAAEAEAKAEFLRFVGGARYDPQQLKQQQQQFLLESQKERRRTAAEAARLLAAACDVYLALVKVFLSQDVEGAEPDVESVISLLSRYFSRINPVRALQELPPNMPLALLAPYLGKTMRHLESQRRAMLVKYGLLKVHFMNLSHEVTQRRIEQLSDMASVPALAQLGLSQKPPTRSLVPINLSSDPAAVAAGAEHEVTCVRHLFSDPSAPKRIVLQFTVRNVAGAGGRRGGATGTSVPLSSASGASAAQQSAMSNVVVRVVPSDEDLFDVEAQIALPFLPSGSTGSCYTVLRERKQTLGVVQTSFSCDLHYNGVDQPLQDIELSTSF
jgi:hypothetical protein